MRGNSDVAASLRSRADAEYGTGASIHEIENAEDELGEFPADYKLFLEQFGWARFNSFEIAGLAADPAEEWMNVVAMTRRWRSQFGMPSHLVCFYDDGAANVECFSTRSDNDTSIYFYSPANSTAFSDGDSFTDFLKRLLDTPVFFRDG